MEEIDMWPFKEKEVSFTEDQAKEMASNAVEEALTTAASGTDSNFRSRMIRESGGYDFADELHNVYCDFGYPAQLQFSNYWNMFRRLGIAKAIVKIPPNTCWLTNPEVEGSDAFNKNLASLAERINLWARLKGLDTRQRVGRYAGLFMRVRDGKPPQEELVDNLQGEAALIEAIPLYESQLKVLDIQEDATKDDFGQPTMYQFTSSSTGTRDPKANENFNIHPSRIVIASEEADDGGIYGFSALEAPYNSLLDIRKILGAGAEGFYKNASQSVIFTLMQGGAKAAKGNEDFLSSLGTTYDDWNANRGRRGFFVPGAEVTALNSSLIQPKEFFMNNLADASASAGIPATIIIGEQTGKLASEKDNESFLTSMQSRRINFLTEVVRNVLDWMIDTGVLPASEYEVSWDDLLAASQSERLANSTAMATVNETQFKSGGQPVFSEEEIREEGGFEPDELPEELPEEEDDDATEIIDEEPEEDEEEAA